MTKIKIEHEVFIYDARGSLLDRVLVELIVFGFLAFCIWLSKGDVFWTFITGVIFISWAYAVLRQLGKKKAVRLHSFDEVIEWAQKKKQADVVEGV